MAVVDRWHLSRPPEDAPRCSEHGLVPSPQHGQGKRWMARWRDDGGQQKKESFAKKSDAERRLTTVEADKLRGAYVDPHDRTTVAEYARTWAADRPHAANTRRRIDRMIRHHIEGTPLGTRRLAAVRPSEVQAWATERGKLLAPSTLRVLVRLLGSIYKAATLDRLVAFSPVVGLSLPRAEGERVVPLSVDQVRTLAEAMPERNRAMVLAQAGLGLRIAELLALRVEDVNFLGRTVRVEWQLDRDLTRTRPKTPKSRRMLPLPTMVAEALAEHVESFPPAEDGTLFTTRFGKPYAHGYYGTRIFQVAVRKAKLPEGTTTHSLRHHYASVLLAAGESVVAVAERLGHQSAGLVLSTYGHLMPDSEDRTRRAVDAAWSAQNVPAEAEDVL